MVHKNTFFVLLAIFAVSCGKKPATEQKENNTVRVKAVAVVEQNISLPIVSSGVITSKKETRLSFKIGGIVAKLFVEEGDNVKAGQLLASLDKTEIDAQVLQAQQNVEKLKRDADRVNSLYKDNATTLEQVQNITTALSVAEQSVKIAKFNQSYASIYANENGKVIKRLMNEGELAGVGAPAYIINSTQENDWVVRIGIADYDWARIQLGDVAILTLDAYPNETFTASVSEIGEAADQMSGTFPVELRVSPNGRKFANGLVAKIEITPKKAQNVKMLPIEAIIGGNGKKAFIYGLTDDRQVKKMPIDIVFFLKDQVAINNDLGNINQVITDGANYLTDNSTIEVVK